MSFLVSPTRMACGGLTPSFLHAVSAISGWGLPCLTSWMVMTASKNCPRRWWRRTARTIFLVELVMSAVLSPCFLALRRTGMEWGNTLTRCFCPAKNLFLRALTSGMVLPGKKSLMSCSGGMPKCFLNTPLGTGGIPSLRRISLKVACHASSESTRTPSKSKRMALISFLRTVPSPSFNCLEALQHGSASLRLFCVGLQGMGEAFFRDGMMFGLQRLLQDVQVNRPVLVLQRDERQAEVDEEDFFFPLAEDHVRRRQVAVDDTMIVQEGYPAAHLPPCCRAVFFGEGILQ